MTCTHVWREEVSERSGRVHVGRAGRLALRDRDQVVAQVHVVDEARSVRVAVLAHEQVHLELSHFFRARKRAVKLKNMIKL